MSEPKKEDIDKQGGWLVRVITPPSLDRLFYVYELDWAKAKELVKAKVPVDAGETIEAVGPANIHALTGNRMKPGGCASTWMSTSNALGTPASSPQQIEART
jgi:hypothetical protein